MECKRVSSSSGQGCKRERGRKGEADLVSEILLSIGGLSSLSSAKLSEVLGLRNEEEYSQ